MPPGKVRFTILDPVGLGENFASFMHLADLKSYLLADERLCEAYRNQDDWARMAIHNIAGSGKFSSDRTIRQYASEIWGVKACPVG